MRRLFALTFLLASMSATSQNSTVPSPQLDSAGRTEDLHHTQDAVPQIMPLDLGIAGSGDSQSGCPVHILRADYERPAHLMPVNARATDDAPIVRLTLSDVVEPISTVEISVSVKFKKSPYQLDTELREIDLRIDDALSGPTSVTRTLTLPANTYGLTRLALKRVDFADGSTWKPVTDRCRYSVAGSVLQAK
jgi:hypothetical protein